MGVLHFKDGPCHVDAIAVVLALEDYQNSIAKNRVRDVAVDIYGVAMVPPPQGRDIFSHQTGGFFFY